MHSVSLADVRPGAPVMVDHDGSWWSGRILRARRGKVRVAYSVLGAAATKELADHAVALRLDPARHGPPAVGARVVAAEHFELFAEAAGGEPVTAMPGWRRGEVVAVTGGAVVVAFDDDGERSPPLPVRAIACFVAAAPAGAVLERVRGRIRDDGEGPVLVAAAVAQGDETVVPRRMRARSFTLEQDDGSRVRVAIGEWPQVTPTQRERGAWEALRNHPLAAPFPEFVPGPHESFELAGEVLVTGDEVEVVGARSGGVVQARLIAGGRRAAAEAAAFVARHTAAPPRPARRGPPRGHLVPVALALVGAGVWLLGGGGLAEGGRVVTCLLLACAVYHHRAVRPLTRFHRRPPARPVPFHIAGEPERGAEDGLVRVYVLLVMLALPVLGLFVALGEEAGAWPGFAVALVWSLALALVLAARERPQARVLRVFARSGLHREAGAWGVASGTYTAGESFTRRIDVHRWSTSRTVTETVATASGGTTQVQRQVTDHHAAAGRSESLPDAILITTAAGTLAVSGCRHAVWGTATPSREEVADPLGTLRGRIADRIAPGDAIAVYGRLQASPSPQVAHTGAGSLMIFGAPPGTCAFAAARARLRGHVISLALILAAALPALVAALRAG